MAGALPARPPLRRAVRLVPPRTLRYRRRIGLLGGSFDPAHQGHRQLSIEALSRLALDEVWWLVSPQNPLKRHMARPFQDRVRHAQQVASHGRIRVVDYEKKLQTQFSAMTVQRLQAMFDARFVFLIGADNLAQLDRWHQWRWLVSRCPIAVFDRNPYSKIAMQSKAAQSLHRVRLREREATQLIERAPPAWIYIHMRPNPASSSAIRTHRYA